MESKCELCGQPMPPGEEMFRYHGHSGPCPTDATCPHCGEPIDENCETKALTYKCGSTVHTGYQSDRCRIAQLEQQNEELRNANLAFANRDAKLDKILESKDYASRMNQLDEIRAVLDGRALAGAVPLVENEIYQALQAEADHSSKLSQQLATAKAALERITTACPPYGNGLGGISSERLEAYRHCERIATEALRQIGETK